MSNILNLIKYFDDYEKNKNLEKENKLNIYSYKISYPELYEIQECPICYENLKINDEVYLIKCCHLFHKECLKDWIKKNNINCPTCREDLKDIYENYNEGIKKINKKREDLYKKLYKKYITNEITDRELCILSYLLDISPDKPKNVIINMINKKIKKTK